MEKMFVADDFPLLGHALSLASRRAQTLESLSAELGLSEENARFYWLIVNKLRRREGHGLPSPFDSVINEPGQAPFAGPTRWYAPTWRLSKLLERFQLNEGLAVHYERILTDPEGGHFELNLAAGEVVAAVRLEHDSLDEAQMKRICVQACAPANGIELLVSNAGNILLHVEAYREQPLTVAFVEDLYAKLIEGISVKEMREIKGHDASVVEELRSKALECFCAHVGPQLDHGCGASPGVTCGNHTLVDALIALDFFMSYRPFPAGNNVLAYLLYFLILHRAGYHFSAHVPVVQVLYARNVPVEHAEGRRLAGKPQDLATECDGSYDWTQFFERAVELLVEEQRWVMTKLAGMSRRRERFRVIIDADETMNYRQKEVLLEAALHSNAEFTYAIHGQRYDVSYPCARSDFARLLDMGFLRQHDDGIRHFFVASDDFEDVFLAYLRKRCSQMFLRYYHEDGTLRDEFKSADMAADAYNKDIGFYEKALLDKTYVEHYDFRRTTIADVDGPRKRKKDGKRKEKGGFSKGFGFSSTRRKL